MDLIVHLAKTKRENDAVAVFVDRFFKAAHFVPCQTSCSAQQLADLFFKNTPAWSTSLHCLRPRCSILFTVLDATVLSTRYPFGYVHSIPSTTDGQSERTIQTLKQYLRVFINKDHSNWDELLDQAEFTYNSNKSASTNLSPFEAMYGFQPSTPVSNALSIPEQRPDKNVDTFIKDHATRFDLIRDALLDAQRRMASQYDRSRTDISFAVGDLVYLDASNLRKPPGLTHKLLPRYRGPFKIIERPSPLNYRLDLPPNSCTHNVFHGGKATTRLSPRSRSVSSIR